MFKVILIAAFLVGGCKSELGGCISLNLIKLQVNKSTLGSYCWTEHDSTTYCIYRKDK